MKAKLLSFVFIYFSKSSLFKDLQPKKIIKFLIPFRAARFTLEVARHNSLTHPVLSARQRNVVARPFQIGSMDFDLLQDLERVSGTGSGPVRIKQSNFSSAALGVEPQHVVLG